MKRSLLPGLCGAFLLTLLAACGGPAGLAAAGFAGGAGGPAGFWPAAGFRPPAAAAAAGF